MEGTVNYTTREFDITTLPNETDRLLTVDSTNVKWYYKVDGQLIMLTKPHGHYLGVSNGQHLVVSSRLDDSGRGGILAPDSSTIRTSAHVARSLVNVNVGNISDFDHVQLGDGSYLARIPVRLL